MENNEELPPGWILRTSRSRPGLVYYHNIHSGESQWDRPVEAAKPPQGEQVRASHILIKHAESRRPSSWKEDLIVRTKEEAREQAEKLRAQLLSKDASELASEFEEIARKESDCSSAKKGGDLGVFGRGAMQKPFEDAAFGLKVGELSDIVETASGIHIIIRTE